ncbi:MAG: hypothetical protein A3G83_15120 [Betaproteobacteria bacterium RIFCSPLOWO2_12_FULL_68_20]|nr:MAG: hypothetical protein A3G83_15120 [Betaproteobacteria bacterium RIFCSPLOWO2_12_FULL_68_20]
MVIRILLQLARELKLEVVAEGVERRDQAAFLANAGCRFVQGYHIARPMPAEELCGWLDAAPAANPSLAP